MKIAQIEKYGYPFCVDIKVLETDKKKANYNARFVEISPKLVRI